MTWSLLWTASTLRSTGFTWLRLCSGSFFIADTCRESPLRGPVGWSLPCLGSAPVGRSIRSLLRRTLYTLLWPVMIFPGCLGLLSISGSLFWLVLRLTSLMLGLFSTPLCRRSIRSGPFQLFGFWFWLFSLLWATTFFKGKLS